MNLYRLRSPLLDTEEARNHNIEEFHVSKGSATRAARTLLVVHTPDDPKKSEKDAEEGWAMFCYVELVLLLGSGSRIKQVVDLLNDGIDLDRYTETLLKYSRNPRQKRLNRDLCNEIGHAERKIRERI